MEPASSPTDGAIARALEQIWREVLGTDDISAESDFFQQGGDSLQMMTMLFRISREIGLEVDPGTVFDNPTIGQLALFLANEQSSRTMTEPAQQGTL
jgi:acyl carrier protein